MLLSDGNNSSHYTVTVPYLHNQYNLLNNGSSFHPVCNGVYGIKWAHEINGLPDPTTNTFVSSVLEVSKRIAVKPNEKKELISPDTLIR